MTPDLVWSVLLLGLADTFRLIGNSGETRPIRIAAGSLSYFALIAAAILFRRWWRS